MNNLLIFFAFPIATIIIAAILQKILKCPIAVAAFIFAIFLIVTFAVFDETFLIATLAYTILALITAFVVNILCRNNNNENQNLCNKLDDIISNLSDTNSENNGDNNLCDAIENITGSNNDNENSNCGCGCNRNRFYRYRRF